MAKEWTPAMSVGVSQIDAQHKELFRQLNALLTAMSTGDAETEVIRTLDFLGRYVVAHFGLEESLMAKYGYPSAGSHKLQHQSFIREFSAVSKQCETYGVSATITLQLHKKLSDWLVNHITRTDKLLGEFIRSRQAA